VSIPHLREETGDVTDDCVVGVFVVFVIVPLAAVMGAATVVFVVVVVTVLKVTVTGPHVTTVGSVVVRITWPHWALIGSGAAGIGWTGGVDPLPPGATGSAGGSAGGTPGACAVPLSGSLWFDPWCAAVTCGDAACAAAIGPPTASAPARAATAAGRLRGDMR
jgi:hypothetical protein